MRHWDSGRAESGDFYCFCLVVQGGAGLVSLVATIEYADFVYHLAGFTALLQGFAVVSAGVAGTVCAGGGERALPQGQYDVEDSVKSFAGPVSPLDLIGVAVGLVAGAFVLIPYGQHLPGAARELPVVFQLAVCAMVSAAALYVVQFRRRYSEVSELAATQSLHHHFLFNTLNTTAYQLDRNPATAVRILTELSELYRAMLRQKPMITLAEETEFAWCYVQLERIRLGDRLGVEWRVPDGRGMRVRTPAMVMQPLIENAIYHGVETREQGGVVRVCVEVRHKRVFFDIRNPVGNLIPESHAQGNHMAQKSVPKKLLLSLRGSLSLYL